jgi:hypothetical protein
MKTKPIAVPEQIPIIEPTTITTPGSYIVSQDFAARPEEDCIAITIATDNVTLDFAGHWIVGTVVVTANGTGNLVIRGGTIAGCELPGTRTNESGPGPKTEGCLRMDGQLGEVRLEGMTVTGCGYFGVSLHALKVTVADCQVGSYDDAIVAVGYIDGHFLANQIYVDDFHGFDLSGSHGEILGNTVQARWRSAQFAGTSNLIRNNVFSGPADDDGITLNTDDSEFSHNVVVSGGNSGIAIHGDRNVITSNTISGAYCGIWFFVPVGGNQYSGNRFDECGEDICGVP